MWFCTQVTVAELLPLAVKMKMRLEVFLLVATVMSAGGKTLKKSAVRNKLLLISFDGFRWDYDQDVDTPHLDQLRKDGVTAKYITPPMLTMTAPSHFTTITGNTHLLPETLAMVSTCCEVSSACCSHSTKMWTFNAVATATEKLQQVRDMMI